MPTMQVDYTRICPDCGMRVNGLDYVETHWCPVGRYGYYFAGNNPSLVFTYGNDERPPIKTKPLKKEKGRPYRSERKH